MGRILVTPPARPSIPCHSWLSDDHRRCTHSAYCVAGCKIARSRLWSEAVRHIYMKLAELSKNEFPRRCVAPSMMVPDRRIRTEERELQFLIQLARAQQASQRPFVPPAHEHVGTWKRQETRFPHQPHRRFLSYHLTLVSATIAHRPATCALKGACVGYSGSPGKA